MVLCFAMMFVPLWNLLAMNMAQISGACSLICGVIEEKNKRVSNPASERLGVGD